MTKKKFWIRTSNGVRGVDGYLEPFHDYANIERFVGVFNAGKCQWNVSCLLTGYMINTAPTKKEAIAKFHEIYEAKYNKLLKEEHKKDSYISIKSKEFWDMVESAKEADNGR